ncbi:MAG: MEKHLA domain-containing protein [Gammaproteobacteria bacterium]
MKIASPSNANDFYAEQVRLLLDSYRRLVGRPLLELSDNANVGEQVFYGDFALASHDTAADPLFNYANRTALDLFEFSWEELIGMPSRFSAEPGKREEREKLLAEVEAKGFIAGYNGIRIAKSGRRFKINNAVVWNVRDQSDVYRGQAAYFKDWIYL